MPIIALKRLLHPFRSPEWVEIGFALMGLVQFIFAVSVFDDLVGRPSLALVIALSPPTWAIAGLLLCTLHISALRYNSYRLRVVAAACSLAFWTHFVGSVFLMAMLTAAALPMTLVPAFAAPLFAGGLLYRLWRHY